MKKRRQKETYLLDFTPKTWDGCNSPLRKRILKKVIAYRTEFHVDPDDEPAKDCLIHRAAFMEVQLETQERHADEEGKIDSGVFTQQINCLMGVFRILGLAVSKRKQRAKDLKSYLKKRRA